MRIAIFGLTISSSWGNGHATLWRGLCKALLRIGHEIVFFEHDRPYYANSRDWPTLPSGGELILYSDWHMIASRAARELRNCDIAIVSSYCFDAVAATDAILEAHRPRAVFYDLDTPVTLSNLHEGKRVSYLPMQGLRDFDLVLSYTGGAALEALRSDLGAHRVRTLYGHVDPDVHRPVRPDPRYRSELSWLGTYSADRQAMLEELFVRPARVRPAQKFLIGGAQYPESFPWTSNVFFVRHVPPGEHAAFFSSARITLNVTRDPMARMGWCPSGRLFEAAACGAAVLSDEWCGLEDFYQPGEQILTARDAADTLAALDMSDAQLQAIARAARQRTLDEHTSEHRARTLLRYLEELHPPKTSVLPQSYSNGTSEVRA
jgi:spore maturation protein CgeB